MNKATLNAAEIKRLDRDLSECASLVDSMLKILSRKAGDGSFDELDHMLQAALEKAGGLADQCLSAIGESPYRGAWEAWHAFKQDKA